MPTSAHLKRHRDSSQEEPSPKRVVVEHRDSAALDTQPSISDETTVEPYTKAQLNDLLLSESHQENIKEFNTVVNEYGWDSKCKLLGTGFYAIVYCCQDSQLDTEVAVKVIRIANDVKFEQVAAEVTVSRELSCLSQAGNFQTTAFTKLHRVHYVTGDYPPALVEAWRKSQQQNMSHDPTSYESTDEFVVLVYELGGKDVEHFKLTSAKQAFSVLHQVVAGLAVAGEELNFVHRDLHMGNILLSSDNVPDQLIYHLDGQKYEIPTYGVCAKIIDFSVSTSLKALEIVNKNRAKSFYEEKITPSREEDMRHLQDMVTILADEKDRYESPEADCHQIYIEKMWDLVENMWKFRDFKKTLAEIVL